MGTTSPPTRVRYTIVVLTTLMAFLLYLDRFCLSFAERYIKDDLRLSNDQTAVLLSAFFWAYALAQVPAGWLSDRFGARVVLALYILLWSLFTGWMGLAFSFAFVLFLRFGCGLAQAGAYPTSAGILSKWSPFAVRGLNSSLIAFGGRVGGAAAPVLTAYLMVAFVPLEVDARLGPDDILDAPGLCRQLARTGNTPPDRLSAVIRNKLSAPAQQVIHECAAEKPDSPALVADMPLLIAELNGVLEQRDLYQNINLDEFPLPSEARSLARLPDDQVTAQQVQRRNRLLLEAAYPDQVRKLYGIGWRPVMLVYGAAGLVVAALFWWLVRNRPQEHPGCNAAEVALIEQGRPATAGSAHGKVGGMPLLPMLRSRSLWLSSLSQFGTNLGWLFLLTWFPRYLAEVHQIPVLQRGWMAGIPILCGMAGMLSGGWVTDRLTRRFGLRWGRCLPMTATRFVAMGAFVACVLLKLPWPVTVALSVVAIATDLGTPSIWAFMQDVGGRHVGSVLGSGNMWGNLGAAVSPIVLNWVIGPGRWDACFLTCAAAFLVSGIAALGVNATIPIIPPDEDKMTVSGAT